MIYCENCYKENLNNYLIDDVGSIFCCEKCFKDFCRNIRNNVMDYQIIEEIREKIKLYYQGD